MDAETRLKFIRSRLKRTEAAPAKPPGMFRSAHPEASRPRKKAGYVYPTNPGGHRAVFGVLLGPAYRRPEWVGHAEARKDGLRVRRVRKVSPLTVIAERLRRGWQR